MPKTIYYQQTNSTRSISKPILFWLHDICLYSTIVSISLYHDMIHRNSESSLDLCVWKIFVVQGLFIHICKYMYPSKVIVTQMIPIFCNKNLSPRYSRKRRYNKQFISEILKPSITNLSSITAKYFFKNLFGHSMKYTECQEKALPIKPFQIVPR